MRLKVIALAAALILVLAISAAVFAEEEYTLIGKVTAYAAGSSIEVNSEGDVFKLALSDQTEVAGNVEVGVHVYVEAMGDTALFIEVDETVEQER